MADENGISQAVLVNEVLHVKGELGVVMLWMMEGVSMVTKILLTVRVKGAQRLVKKRMSRSMTYHSVDWRPQISGQHPTGYQQWHSGEQTMVKGRTDLLMLLLFFLLPKRPCMKTMGGRPA